MSSSLLLPVMHHCVSDVSSLLREVGHDYRRSYCLHEILAIGYDGTQQFFCCGNVLAKISWDARDSYKLEHLDTLFTVVLEWLSFSVLINCKKLSMAVWVSILW